MNIDDVTDGLGKKLDQRIKPLVNALLNAGFHTVQSCQGHRDWGLPYPWVDIIETDDLNKLNDLLKRFNDSSDFYWIHKRKYMLDKGIYSHRIFPISSQRLNSLQSGSILLANFIKQYSKYDTSACN